MGGCSVVNTFLSLLDSVTTKPAWAPENAVALVGICLNPALSIRSAFVSCGLACYAGSGADMFLRINMQSFMLCLFCEFYVIFVFFM